MRSKPKHILITAPELYSKRLRSAFERGEFQDSLKFTYLPLITTQRLENRAEIDRFIYELSNYDLLIFCSRMAIESFAEYVEELGVELPGSCGYCAIGKDNEALESCLGIAPTFISSEPSPQGIINHLAQQEGIEGQRVAVLAPVVEGITTPDTVPNFIAGLQNIGVRVEEIASYCTKGVDAAQSLSEIIDTLDAVAFCSGAEVEVFLRIVGENRDSLSHLIYGPYTANYAQKLGLRVDMVNPNFDNFDQFIRNIANYYQQH